MTDLEIINKVFSTTGTKLTTRDINLILYLKTNIQDYHTKPDLIEVKPEPKTYFANVHRRTDGSYRIDARAFSKIEYATLTGKELGNYVKTISFTVGGEEWISVKNRLPEPKTPVLGIVRGYEYPLVIERRWETCNPMIESYFEDFLYWDDVNNDGQDLDDSIVYWRPLPELPKGDEK